MKSRLAKSGPGAIAVKPKRIKNFIYINMPAWEQKRFRALAECYGMPFNVVVRWAIYDYRLEIERRTGIAASDAEQLPPAERRAKGAAFWQMRRKLDCGGKLKVATN